MNELWPSRCEICSHYARSQCDKLSKNVYIKGDPNRYLSDKVIFFCDKNFYCQDFSAKNPIISKEEQERITKGQIKHED